MSEITNCPKCQTPLRHASGIGDFCPNTECDVFDGMTQAAGLAPECRVDVSETQNRMIEKMRSTLRHPEIRAALSHEPKETHMLLKFRCLPHCPSLPRYATDGSAGMDLMAAEDTTIKPREWDNVLTGLCVQIPSGSELQIRSRSGLAMRGIQAHFGTIDEDYRGEIRVILFNHSGEVFEIRKGDRIAQCVLAPVCRAQIVQVVDLLETARGDGGFGSTGV